MEILIETPADETASACCSAAEREACCEPVETAACDAGGGCSCR
jgi:hypothetical protein